MGHPKRNTQDEISTLCVDSTISFPSDSDEAEVVWSESNEDHPFRITGLNLFDNKDISGAITGACSSGARLSDGSPCQVSGKCPCGGCAMASNVKWLCGSKVAFTYDVRKN